MTTFNTGNPVPSSAVKDLFDNAETEDYFVNSDSALTVTRTGKTIYTMAGFQQLIASALANGVLVSVGAYIAGLTVGNYNQIFSYLGDWYRAKPGTTLPYTMTGTPATDLPFFTNVGDAALRTQLAATTGAALVGTTYGPLSTWILGNPQYETPEKYGYTPGGTLAARTAAFQAAFDAAQVSKKTVGLSGTYIITKLLIEDDTEYHITGTAVIVGVATTAQSAVVEIKNSTAITSSGNITISAAENPNYSAVCKVWGSGGTPGNLRTCSLHSLNFNLVGCAIGWQFGDYTAPDNLLSEIVIYNCYTYNTPQAAVVIGTQAVIEFNGAQLVSSGTGTLTGAAHGLVLLAGGKVTTTGGEAQMPGNFAGFGFVSVPINSTSFDNTFGRFFLNGTKIECAGLLFLGYNPASVPSPAPLTGGIKMSCCSGYHSFTGVSFQGDASFSGQVVVDDTNSFYAAAVRSAPTAAMLNAFARVKIGEMAFDANFVHGLAGITGGTVSFDFQQILEARNLNGQAIGSGGNAALIFSGVSPVPINARFSSAYNPTTGVFTVPAGGLKSVEVFFVISSPARLNSEVDVLVDSVVPVGLVMHSSKYLTGVAKCGDLVQGQTIFLRYTNSDTGTQTFGASNSDRLVISARG